MKHTYAVLLLCTGLLAYSGCDKGLEPGPPPRTGFGGTIHLVNWPRIDSVDFVVWELRLAVFKEVPVDTSGLFNELIRGNVLIYPQIGQTAFAKRDSNGRLRDTIQYSYFFTDDVSKPRTFKYIAMAWRYSPAIFTDWRPAGLHATQPFAFSPASITIRQDIFLNNVDIYCDFRNPPPKPWR